MKTLWALLLVFGVAAHAAEGWVQGESSDNLSQFVRSNVRHYWATMREQADLGPVRSYLPFAGMVAGDPHMGNFAPRPLVDHQDRRAMRFVDVDFDDAGQAPFVLDFIRYVIVVEASFPEIKKRTLEEAYVRGLKGEAAQPPSSLDSIFGVSVDNYDQRVKEYLEKNTDGDAFRFRVGKIEKYNGEITRASLAKIFAGAEVLDVALRPKERGGSADGLRLWVLIKREGQRQIMELKERLRPATGEYQTQDAVGPWLKQVHATFWPGLDTSDYELVEVDGKLFWRRPKAISIVDVPYSSERQKAKDCAADLAAFDANLLGLVHGRQKDAELYLRVIEADREAFHQAVQTITRDYLKLAKRAYRHAED